MPGVFFNHGRRNGVYLHDFMGHSQGVRRDAMSEIDRAFFNKVVRTVVTPWIIWRGKLGVSAKEQEVLANNICEAIQAENRALHSQVRELTQECEYWRGYQEQLSECRARITALSHENAELTARTGQLEGALKAVVDTWDAYLTSPSGYPAYQRAKKALTPGVYKEWCRDPKLCQDKGTCPLDPTCAD
jgi:hypothetical protein